ncbi:MAG TPA: O-antigen ligase family protein [Solirubrobacteraceae bacterium]
MPIGWLAVIAPHNADVWSRALSPLHEPGPSWAPISLDPTATRVEVLKGVAYLLAFVTALRVARRREGVAFLGAVIVLTGVVLAVVAVLHPAFGAHKLYGLYEPGSGIAERHIAPLLDPNNLAGYLNVSFCFALAAALAPDPRIPRPIAGAAVLLLVATQVWIASRAGVTCMILGAIVVVAIRWYARSREQRIGGTILSLVTGGAAVAGVVLIVLAGSNEASGELLDDDVSKLQMFQRVMRMLPAVPFFGCGRGAFESAYPVFRTGYGFVTYTHPENVIAQWILEWGLPISVAGFAALAFALRPTEMFARSTTAAGGWAGLVALAIQNLGDLGTEIPGLLLAGVVCAAVVVGGTPGRAAPWRGARWAGHPRIIVIAGGAAAAFAMIAVGGGIGRELAQDRRRMYDAALDASHPVDAMRGQVRAAMLRHPAEPYLPFAMGLRVFPQAHEDAIPWIGATLERAPVYGPAHLVLARAVASRAPSQARLEYRIATEQAPEQSPTALAEAARLVGSYEDALELVGPGKQGTQTLGALTELLEARLPATSVRLDAELASRDPTDSRPVLRAAAAAVADVEARGAPWCDGPSRRECLGRARELVERGDRLAPTSCVTHTLGARLQIAEGDVQGALEDLSAATDVVVERGQCLRELVVLAGRVGDNIREDAAIARITTAGCADDSGCARDFAWIGGVEERRGNTGKALAQYKRAYEHAPDDDALLEEVARLAAAAGLHAEAAEDYDRLAQRHPAQEKWRNAAQKERDEAMRRAVQL